MSLGGLSGGSALDEELKRSNVIRLRGLPFSASEQDIADFFKGLDLGPDGVVIQVNFQGRSTGQAYVQFASAEQANKALDKNRQHIGSRYIEVFKGHPSDMEASLRMVGRGGGSTALEVPTASVAAAAAAAAASAAASAVVAAPPSQGMASQGLTGTGIPGMSGNPDMRYTGVVRMRGMPYSCTNADITAFFKGMQVAPDGIFLQTHADGRPTGEAYVEFATEETAARAMQLHREPMGSRYVELFRSTKGEMMTAVQQKMYGMYPAANSYSQYGAGGQQGYNSMPNMTGVMTGMGIMDPTGENVCIKMRGLPYNAGQREIMDFFEGYNIVPNGIHVVMGGNERPTGEAFVEFTNSEEAGRAMERHRQNIGSRYIELFRATKSEALMAMGGGAFNMTAGLDAQTLQILMLQQQMAAAAAMGMGGSSIPANWGMAEMQAAAAMYQQAAGTQGGAGGSTGGAAGGYSYDPSASSR